MAFWPPPWLSAACTGFAHAASGQEHRPVLTHRCSRCSRCWTSLPQVWRHRCGDRVRIVPHRRADRVRVRASYGAPSSGSKATQKRPAFSTGTMIGSSFSSLTRTEHAPELTRAETKISLESTSSFFWSSPLEFWSPAMPKRLAMPALAHAREVALQARPSCAIRIVNCGRTQRALVSRLVCGKAVGRASDLHVLGVAHQPPAKANGTQGETGPLAARRGLRRRSRTNLSCGGTRFSPEKLGEVGKRNF
eukprot:scaffold15240_cov36-Phaeocystis_antarctica.AAC.2